jgi:hypothetical protein
MGRQGAAEGQPPVHPHSLLVHSLKMEAVEFIRPTRYDRSSVTYSSAVFSLAAIKDSLISCGEK